MDAREGNSGQKMEFRESRGRSGGCQGLAHTTYWFFQTAGQVHNRDIGGWHTESHSSKFPVKDTSQQGTAAGQAAAASSQGGTTLTH